ncbi:MAG: flagellar biosynthetic protein FliR [Pseudomonadota bacterium]
MIELLASYVPIARDLLLNALLALFRVGAVFAVLPVFGERSIPTNVRLVLAAGTVLILTPLLPNSVYTEINLSWMTGLILSEAVIGLTLGLAIRLLILALQISGSIAAQSTSISQIFGGSNVVEAQPAIGQLLVVAGLALAATADLHIRLVEMFLLTYDFFPVGALVGAASLGEWGVDSVARSFSLGFILAAPFVVASFIYNLALGAISRAMPQLMVALVGAPAITGAGLVLLMLCAPLMLQVWLGVLEEVLANPFGR